jgi:CspA family cold shock protein
MDSNTDIVTTSALSEHLIGRVKWFNNKTGYGFITVTDGEKSGSDIFVHHSSIQVVNQQYKYLLQGEYVEFDLLKSTSGKYEWQATNVIGINSGKLMCETRFESKISRTNYKNTKTPDESPSQSETRTIEIQEVVQATTSQKKQRQPCSKSNVRGEGPRADAWSLVKKTTRKKPTNTKSVETST